MWHDCVFSVGTLRRYDSTVEGVRTKKKMQEKKKKRPARKSQETTCDSLQMSPKKPLLTLRIYLKGRVVVVQSKSCRTLCDHMDVALAGYPVHGMLQARILEWVSIPSSSGIFPTQGSNPDCQYRQAGSLPLSHLGSSESDTRR